MRQFLREARFAATADAGQREELRIVQQARAIVERLFATDETGSQPW